MEVAQQHASLWMGSPVITLSGIVMSVEWLAVLHGAGLEDWCMQSEDEYLSLPSNKVPV